MVKVRSYSGPGTDVHWVWFGGRTEDERRKRGNKLTFGQNVTLLPVTLQKNVSFPDIGFTVFG